MTDSLPIKVLQPNPDNPRMETGDVSELVESIRSYGILEPLVVSPHGKRYLVVCGHRRVKAAKLAGLTEVPVVIREIAAKDRELIALTENVHRKQLSPIEEAIAYTRLMKSRGLTQQAVAKLMHVSDYTVSTRLALLRLPKAVIDQVHAGEMTINEAIGLERRGREAKVGKTHRSAPRARPRCAVGWHDNCPGDCEVRKLSRSRRKAAA